MKSRRLSIVAAISAVALLSPHRRSVQAAAPTITITATSARIQITSASLAETIDALARAGAFKVAYDGPRPTAMLFNAEVETPSVAQTLFRLLEGQNLNYAVLFDLSGTKVTSLMILGAAPKSGGSTGTAGTASRPQPFATPRMQRNDLPPVDDDINETPEAPPVEASPSPAPTVVPRGPAGPGAAPTPLSPFGPRPFGGPFGPRPQPSPTPSP